jgi:GTP-binding protein
MTKPVRAEFLKSAGAPSDFPATGAPEVAFVGRSNVGKSSLLNRLAGAGRLAHVSKTPGRTQLINFFRVNDRIFLVDLPGYGFAKVPLRVRKRWEELISSYLFRRSELRLVLLVIDIRRDPMPNDLEVRDLLQSSGKNYVVVATKSDKLPRAQLARQRAKLEEKFGADGSVPLITFSAVTGQGRKELWAVIEKHAREAKAAPKAP